MATSTPSSRRGGRRHLPRASSSRWWPRMRERPTRESGAHIESTNAANAVDPHHTTPLPTCGRQHGNTSCVPCAWAAGGGDAHASSGARLERTCRAGRAARGGGGAAGRASTQAFMARVEGRRWRGGWRARWGGACKAAAREPEHRACEAGAPQVARAVARAARPPFEAQGGGSAGDARVRCACALTLLAEHALGA
eukprot:6908061-Prymnesium_polylepis.2